MSTPQPSREAVPTAEADFDAEMRALSEAAVAVPVPPQPPAVAVETPVPQGPAPAPDNPPVTSGLDLAPLLEELRRMGAVETANRQLFDTLHAELRQYRDGFLLESLHLPVIRDLISLLDDMESVRRQVDALLPGTSGGGVRARGEVARSLERAASNLENTLHFLREILQRIDVEEVGMGDGSFQRAIHRQVGVEQVSDAADHGRVASVVRSGFQWRGRTLRPAEVIVRRSDATPTGGE